MANQEQQTCEEKGACSSCKVSKAPMTIFASKSLTEHVLRGVLGLSLLLVGYQMIAPGQSLPVFGGGLALLGLSLWALRGCPVCWSVGLINTVAGILHRKQEARRS